MVDEEELKIKNIVSEYLKNFSNELDFILDAKLVASTMAGEERESNANRNNAAAVRGALVVALKKRFKRDYAICIIDYSFQEEDLTVTHGRKILKLISGLKSDVQVLTKYFGTMGRKADEKSQFDLSKFENEIQWLTQEYNSFCSKLNALHKSKHKAYKKELKKILKTNRDEFFVPNFS